MTTNWRYMRRTIRLLPLILAAALGAGMGGCKSKPPKPPPPPPPVVLTINFTASTDVNPDAQSRPSPLVVRFYQLKDDSGFKDADIYAFFDKEQAALGGGLVSREEYQLAPGEKRGVIVTPAPEVHYLGVVAAYRDIRTAQWRALIGTPDKSRTIGVNLARTSVSLTAN